MDLKDNSSHESRRGGIQIESRMGRSDYQDKWRGEEELAFPEFLMKADMAVETLSK